MDDIRYSELQFLRLVAGKTGGSFCCNPLPQAAAVGLNPNQFTDMAATLVEELYLRFDEDQFRRLVAKLRGELSPGEGHHGTIPDHDWNDPRAGLHSAFNRQDLRQLSITFRGLRRIEELRDMLRRDRILEPFGVLLDLRYVLPDLNDALMRDPETPVSVLYADLDNFKPINKLGHAAGNVIMKAYLETVRDCLGLLGAGYRGRGDEVVGIIVGQGHQRAVELAEKIRFGVEALKCEYKGQPLPRVTASIGVATTPPAARSADIETLADFRNNQAKEAGKNRICEQ